MPLWRSEPSMDVRRVTPAGSRAESSDRQSSESGLSNRSSGASSHEDEVLQRELVSTPGERQAFRLLHVHLTAKRASLVMLGGTTLTVGATLARGNASVAENSIRGVTMLLSAMIVTIVANISSGGYVKHADWVNLVAALLFPLGALANVPACAKELVDCDSTESIRSLWALGALCFSPVLFIVLARVRFRGTALSLLVLDAIFVFHILPYCEFEMPLETTCFVVIYHLLIVAGNYYLDNEYVTRLEVERELLYLRSRSHRARKRARRMERVKDEFLRYAFHEIRTPFTAVSLGVDAMAANMKKGPAMQVAQLTQQNCQRMSKLMDDVMSWAVIEVGRFSINPKPLLLRREVAALLDTCTLLSSQLRIALTYEVDDSVPDRVTLDWQRVSQVLSNLVSNALKYTKPGGAIDLRVALQTKDGGPADRIIISVADTGIGITAEGQRRLFQAYKPVDMFNKTSNSTGLGLAISRSIVQTHGGRIWVESAPERGSTFFVDLPLVEHDEEAPPASFEDVEHPYDEAALRALLEGKKLLIVEPAASTRRLLARYFTESLGSLATGTPGVRDANLCITDFGLPDIAVVSATLPDGDAAEFAASLLDRGMRGPIVCLTPNVLDESLRLPQAPAWTAVLSKPLNKGELQAVLAKAFAYERPRFAAPPASSAAMPTRSTMAPIVAGPSTARQGVNLPSPRSGSTDSEFGASSVKGDATRAAMGTRYSGSTMVDPDSGGASPLVSDSPTQ